MADETPKKGFFRYDPENNFTLPDEDCLLNSTELKSAAGSLILFVLLQNIHRFK